MSHSKGLKNDVTEAINGFKSHKAFYSFTDSFYICKLDYQILYTQGLTGRELFESKNDNGVAGRKYGLSLAPKIKNCIVNDENGVISQKTPLIGYDQITAELVLKIFLNRKEVLLSVIYLS